MIYPIIQYKSAVIKLFLIGVLFVLGILNGSGQQLDYRAQSLYIYKFTKFITWPEEKTKGDFIIGVYGNSPIMEELILMASIKKAAKDQNIVVKEITTEEDLMQYNIIYVASSKSRQIRSLADQIGNQPVLIVAEREGMAYKGATISFIITNYEILKFEVDVDQLENQQMTISEDLIKLGFKL
jgi:hypothetical protein